MHKPKQKSLQEYLFQRIRELLPPGKTLADAVSEVLHLSQDSTYRRLRGETILVLEEARELCQTFGISLDELFQLENNSVVFYRTEIEAGNYDFTNYLRGILRLLQHLDSFREKAFFT